MLSWFYSKPQHSAPDEDFEVIDRPDSPLPQAEWFDKPPATGLTPAFTKHKKRKPKLTKEQKKSRRHIRAMWP